MVLDFRKDLYIFRISYNITFHVVNELHKIYLSLGICISIDEVGVPHS